MDKKKGFIVYNFDQFDMEHAKFLRECKNHCQSLTVAIPSDEFFLQVTGKEPQKSFDEKREILLYLKSVDEVVSLDVKNMHIKNSYQEFRYDLFFYGAEYGSRFQQDSEYLKEQGVELLSLLPEKLEKSTGRDTLQLVLKNVSADRKIVLFGTGSYFDYYMKNYGEHYPPAYAIDNFSDKWNSTKAGINIVSPETLTKEDPKKVFIVLCCKDHAGIVKQIKSIGEFDYRPLRQNHEIALWEEHIVILQEEEEYMEHAHNILMKLTKEFDRVCSKLGLRYYVIGGSLIGIIRHQGLIPWDDDVDVAMFREDYEILRQKAPEIWPKDSAFLFLDYDQFGENVFYDFFTRLIYMEEEISTRLFKKVSGKAREDIQNKLALDIFVLENADRSKIKHTIVTTMIKGLYALAMGHRGYVDYKEYAFLPKAMLMILKAVHKIGGLIPLNGMFYIYEKLRGYARNKDCSEVFESNNGAINYMPWRYKKTIYGQGKRMKMCDYDVMVPEDCDALLKGKGYGDYMMLPSVNCRKPSHSAKAEGVIW